MLVLLCLIFSVRLLNFSASSIELTDRFSARTRCLLRSARTRCLLRAGFAGVSRTSILGLMLDASLYKIAHRNLLESLIVLGSAAPYIVTHMQAARFARELPIKRRRT